MVLGLRFSGWVLCLGGSVCACVLFSFEFSELVYSFVVSCVLVLDFALFVEFVFLVWFWLTIAVYGWGRFVF